MRWTEMTGVQGKAGLILEYSVLETGTRESSCSYERSLVIVSVRQKNEAALSNPLVKAPSP